MFKKSNVCGKIASGLLSGGIILGMAGTAGAGSTSTITDINSGTATTPVKGYIAENEPISTTYNISVTWGDMVFVFDKGYSNGTDIVRATTNEQFPNETEKGVNNWFGIDGTNNLVSIENNSNAKVDISASVSKVTDDNPEANTVPSAMEPVTLTLTGGADQDWSGAASSASGSLTSTIDEAISGNAAPTKDLTLSLSGTPNDGLSNDSAHPSEIGTITLNFTAHAGN